MGALPGEITDFIVATTIVKEMQGERFQKLFVALIFTLEGLGSPILCPGCRRKVKVRRSTGFSRLAERDWNR